MKTLRIAVATIVLAACGLLAAATPASAAPCSVLGAATPLPAAIYGDVSLHISDNHTACSESEVTVQVTSDPNGLVCTTLTVSVTNDARVRKGGSLAQSQTFSNVETPFAVRIRVNPDSEEEWSATTHAVCEYDDEQTPQALGTAPDLSGDALALMGDGVVLPAALAAAMQTVETSGVLSSSGCPVLDDDTDADDDDSDSDDSDSDSDDSDSDGDDDDNGLPNTGGQRLLWLIIGLLLLVGGTIVVIQSRREDGAES